MAGREDERALAAAFEAAVRAVPGVTNVFRSGSLVGNAMAAAAEHLGWGEGGAPLVSVALDAEGVSVEVSLGADASSAVGDTVRAVQRAIDEVAHAAGTAVTSCRATVVHVRG
jgi:hypothetical protein